MPAKARRFASGNPAEAWPMSEVSEKVVERYKKVYSIPSDFPVTTAMVRDHVELEYRLTQRMINTPPELRARVWSESYDQLYRSLEWRPSPQFASPFDPVTAYGHFLKLIPAGARVFEVGSGTGFLADYLTVHGRPCVATDISCEPGKVDSIAWHHTDGIHLANFEQIASYDAVVSTQVIEHLHPDDVEEHFRGAFQLLRSGGQYVLATPHVFLGPADLSAVFGLDRACFMHLKEYTHRELGDIARRVGFRRIEAVYVPPLLIRKNFPFMLRSRLLYRYLGFWERALAGLRVPRVMLRALLFHRDVCMVLTK